MIFEENLPNSWIACKLDQQEIQGSTLLLKDFTETSPQVNIQQETFNIQQISTAPFPVNLSPSKCQHLENKNKNKSLKLLLQSCIWSCLLCHQLVICALVAFNNQFVKPIADIPATTLGQLSVLNLLNLPMMEGSSWMSLVQAVPCCL